MNNDVINVVLCILLSQAIVMKDGKIQHQGTLSEIRTRDPDLYNTWQGSIHQDMDSEESTSEEGEVLESPRLKEERDALKRQVSRQMSEEGEGGGTFKERV